MPITDNLKAQCKFLLMAGAGASLLAVSGCSSAPDESPSWAWLLGEDSAETLEFVFSDSEDVTVDPEDARNFSFSAAYVQIDGFPRVLVYLARVDELGLNAPRLQWLSGSGEVLETLNGRVVGIHGLTNNRGGVIANLPQALECFQDSITKGGQAPEACAEEYQGADWAFDMTMQTPYHSVYTPHLRYNRIQAQLSYQVVDSAYALPMPNGDTLSTLRVQETSVEPAFTNEFYIDRSSGQVVMSKQWLGESLGYIRIQDVQPYRPQEGGLTPDSTPDSPYRYVDKGVEDTSGWPEGTLTVKVNTTDNELLRVHFNGEPRMSQAIELLPPDGAGWFYQPLTRLHSAKLDQEFNARRQGMRLRLLMLAQTYRAEGDTALAEAATELLNEFDSWPLRGTYIHGFNLGDARTNLAQNHKLTMADARSSESSAPWYEIQLNSTPQGAIQTGLVNHALSEQALVYTVDARGIITRVPVAPHNSNAELQAIAQQPGAITLYSLPDDKLPKGFRDLNYQLSLFLQHWDFSQ